MSVKPINMDDTKLHCDLRHNCTLSITTKSIETGIVLKLIMEFIRNELYAVCNINATFLA